MADIEQQQQQEEKKTTATWKCVAKANTTLVKSLLHGVISQLNKQGRHILKFKEYSSAWNLQQYWQVCEVCENLVLAAGKDSWTKDQVFSYLGDALPETYKQDIFEVINSRREDIEKLLHVKTASISERELQNFDWKVNLVMSSDKLGTIHEPLCNLDLEIRDGEKTTNKAIELNSDDIKALIKSLEAANKTVLQYTS